MFFDMVASGGCGFSRVLQIAVLLSCKVPTFSHTVPQLIYKHSQWKKILSYLAATRTSLLNKTERGTTEYI